MRAKQLAVVMMAALALAACDSGTDPEPDPTVDGVWLGHGNDTSGTAFVLRLTLVESDDGEVSGSGTIGSPSVPDAFAISVRAGAHIYPDLSLTLAGEGFADVALSGTVQRTQIVASLNGSGFVDAGVILEKQ